jgi:hypothetical protein
VNEKKDDADDQPDDREGVEDALEKGFQFSGSQVVRSQIRLQGNGRGEAATRAI